MRKWKQLLAAVLLTAFLVGLGLVNTTELLGDRGSQIGEAQIVTAAIGASLEIYYKKAQYQDGVLVGCSGKGNDCVVIVLKAAGLSTELLVAGTNVMLK